MWLCSKCSKGFSVESGFGASEHPPCSHCERTNHPPERCWIKYPHKRPKKKTGKFPKKKDYKKDSDKSEGAGATIHQVYSVMARASPEERILDSGASAHMTGIKSLLKDYKKVAMTTVTVANGDILPAKGVGISPSRPNRVTALSQVFYTYQDWIGTSFRFLNLPQRVLQYEC